MHCSSHTIPFLFCSISFLLFPFIRCLCFREQGQRRDAQGAPRSCSGPALPCAGRWSNGSSCRDLPRPQRSQKGEVAGTSPDSKGTAHKRQDGESQTPVGNPWEAQNQRCQKLKQTPQSSRPSRPTRGFSNTPVWILELSIPRAPQPLQCPVQALRCSQPPAQTPIPHPGCSQPLPSPAEPQNLG